MAAAPPTISQNLPYITKEYPSSIIGKSKYSQDFKNTIRSALVTDSTLSSSSPLTHNPLSNHHQQRQHFSMNHDNFVNFDSQLYNRSPQPEDSRSNPNTTEAKKNENVNSPKGRSRCGRKGDPASRRQHEIDLKKAIILVVLNDYSLRQAATATGVSHETLRRRLQNLKMKNEASRKRNEETAMQPQTTKSINNHQHVLSLPHICNEFEVGKSPNFSQNSSPNYIYSNQSVSSSTGLENNPNWFAASKSTEVASKNVNGQNGRVINNNPNESNSGTTNFDIRQDTKQISKMKASLEGFEKVVARELVGKNANIQRTILEEFSKAKSSVFNYVDHTMEALQTARIMVLDEIEQNEVKEARKLSSVNSNKHSSNLKGKKVATSPAFTPLSSQQAPIDSSLLTPFPLQPPYSYPRVYDNLHQRSSADNQISRINSISSLIHSDNVNSPEPIYSQPPHPHLPANPVSTNLASNNKTLPSLVASSYHNINDSNQPYQTLEPVSRPVLPPPTIRGSQVPIIALLSEEDC